jgi:hypothetical protein
MSNRINASQIKVEFDSAIAHADITEPQLAERLRQLSRWIKNTKPGSLTKKKFVLNLLIEVLQDAKTWLKVKDLDSEEKIVYYREAELTPPELYWYETLFPGWFHISDPKLAIWTKKLMAEEFSSIDDADILGFVSEFENLGAPVFYRYILDLSMATDILIGGSSKRSLAVQLTKSNPKLLSEKQNNWKETLIYWSIKRGVLFSQSPSHPIHESARSLLMLSDSLDDGCYVVDRSTDN